MTTETTAAEQTTDETTQEAQETAQDGTEGSETPETTGEAQGGREQPETFPRAYVEDLRRENATYRERARRADALATHLVTAYTDATGRLADPTDLEFSTDLLDDDGIPDRERITAAIDALLARKPHLASRRPVGDVGQGVTGEPAAASLASILRAHAG